MFPLQKAYLKEVENTSGRTETQALTVERDGIGRYNENIYHRERHMRTINGSVPLWDTEMQYVAFGEGEKTLVVLPGLSDGLVTVRGKARLLAQPYRLFDGKYTVYMFSRKDQMPDGYSIRDMAADQADAMQKLGIEKAAVLGVSEGGMIAQMLAIEYPLLVERLIIAVSSSAAGDMARENVRRWIGFAEAGDHRALMIDTAERSYSASRLASYRKLYPVLGKIGRPKDYRRFLVNARAILSFDAACRVDSIACPTLIIGGGEDRIVGAEASRELHEKIRGSELYIYPSYGHAAYEEAKDFYKRVFQFLEKED